MSLDVDRMQKTHIKSIDDEHKKLIEQANKLIKALEDSNKNQEEIIKTLDCLNDYVCDHFINEENLQSRYAYPELDDHKEAHDKFRQEIDALINEIQSNGLSLKSKIGLNKMLVKWLEDHLNEADKELGDYIKNQIEDKE